MSNNINLVQISGNLGKAPEFKAEVGTGLATFQLAHNRFIPNQGENSSHGSGSKAEFTKRTSWFRCVGWGNMAEKVAKLEKDARVVVTGRLESHSWQDKQGNTQSRVEIVVEDFRLVDTSKAAQIVEAIDEVEEAPLVQATLNNAMVKAEEAEDEPPIDKSRSAKPAKFGKAANKPQPKPGIISGVPDRSRSRSRERPAASQSRWQRNPLAKLVTINSFGRIRG
jgi:single stranded DNA-binding protein